MWIAMSRPWAVIVGCMVSLGIAAWDVGTALLFEQSVEPDVESWLYSAASAVVVVLLLLPASNRWFRDPSAPLAFRTVRR